MNGSYYLAKIGIQVQKSIQKDLSNQTNFDILVIFQDQNLGLIILISHTNNYILQLMIGQSKPLYQFQRKLTYQRHLVRLQQIQKERSKKVSDSDSLLKMQRIRNKSMQFRTQKLLHNLNQQNQKLINSILQISKDKRSIYSTVQQPVNIQHFNNPARKRKQREIDTNNLRLAERILGKQSDFDPTVQRKNIQLYEEVKKRMENNKKASVPQLQKIERARSVQRSRRKSKMSQNPQ